MKRLFLAIFALCMGINAYSMDLPMAEVGKKRQVTEIEGIEQAPAAKEERIETKEEQIQRIQSEKRQEAEKAISQSKSALLTEYPKEIQERIRSLLNTAPGFGLEKLYNVAQNLRNLRLVSKAERDKLDDPTFVNELIVDLAQRYTRGDTLKVALILHTKSAADWLNNELVANNKLDQNKLLLKKATNLIIEQLNQGHTDAALFLINSAKISGKEAYLLNFNYINLNGDNLLLAASRAGDWKIFSKLLPQSLQYINTINTVNSTALFEAIDRGHTQIALALISAGAHALIKESPNDEILDSALLHASSVNNTEVVRKLLHDPLVKENITFTNDFYPFTPLYYAVAHNNYPIFQLLLKEDVFFSGDLLYKALAQNTQMVKDLVALLDDTDSLNIESVIGPTMIVPAASGIFDVSSENKPTVSDSDARDRLQLILPKIAINQKESSGATLLMRAVQQAKSKTLKALLDAGADVNLTDRHGHDALWYAQQLESHNKDHIIKMLEEAKKKQEKIFKVEMQK